MFYDGPTVIVEVHQGARAKIVRHSPICAWFAPDRVAFIVPELGREFPIPVEPPVPAPS